MGNLNKGILSSIVDSLSPIERKLLAVLGLIASRKVKTRGEKEIQEYQEQGWRKRLMEKRAENILRDEVARMSALGLTKTQILEKINTVGNNLKKMAAAQATKDTYEPDVSEFAVYACPTCGFTIDAQKNLDPAKLLCRYCDGVHMKGIRREDFHTKDGNTGFNEVDEASDIPEDPKVKT